MSVGIILMWHIQFFFQILLKYTSIIVNKIAEYKCNKINSDKCVQRKDFKLLEINCNVEKNVDKKTRHCINRLNRRSPKLVSKTRKLI